MLALGCCVFVAFRVVLRPRTRPETKYQKGPDTPPTPEVLQNPEVDFSGKPLTPPKEAWSEPTSRGSTPGQSNSGGLGSQCFPSK
eukprot:1133850-Amphidinium_carterae.1